MFLPRLPEGRKKEEGQASSQGLVPDFRTRVLIADAVLAPGNEPHGAKWLDLLMLTISGRERTEPEWRTLVEGAGLRLDAIEDGLIQASCP